MEEGSFPITIIYRVCYKAFCSAAIPPKSLTPKLEPGQTMLFQTDLKRTNVITPKAIKWQDISLPEYWDMEEAVTPMQPAPARSTEIQKIEQYSDGRVRLSFARNSIDLAKKVDYYLFFA